METRVLRPGDPAWDTALRDAPHDVYHLPAYSSLSSFHEGGEPVAIHVVDGQRSLLLPVIVRALPDGSGCDATSPYGYPGPVGRGCDDPAFLDAAMGAATGALREMGGVALFVRLHPLLNAVTPPGIGQVVDHGVTVGIDLTVSPEEAWRQTRENHQRGIKRALRDGFVAEASEADADLLEFIRVYEQTMTRLQAHTYYYFDRAYYDRMRAALGEHLRLIVVRKGEDIAAAGLFFVADGIVQYHLSGSDERYLAWQPTKLLIHEARRWGHERGERWMHLGGGLGAADDSLFLFKAGFSPLRHRFCTLRIVAAEDRYRALSHSPAGPLDLDGFFPAYRRRVSAEDARGSVPHT